MFSATVIVIVLRPVSPTSPRPGPLAAIRRALVLAGGGIADVLPGLVADLRARQPPGQDGPDAYQRLPEIGSGGRPLGQREAGCGPGTTVRSANWQIFPERAVVSPAERYRRG